MIAGARRLHPRDAFGSFRRSLGLRMVALTLSIGIVLIVLLTLVVSNLIRDDVFEDRSVAILSDAHQRVAAAQAELDNADTTTADQVAAATKNMVAKLGQISAASGAVGVVFLRASDETSAPVVNNMYTDPALLDLVGDDLAATVAGGQEGRQYWKSVSVPGTDGEQVPGIIVGSRLSVPTAGGYDLYLVYTLQPEQQLIDLTTRAIALAAIGFLLMLVLTVWALAVGVLIPVRRTSLAVRRLAEGHLDERLKVTGEDEIATLSHSFNEMADSLARQLENWERLSSVQRLFVSDVSHELRTPLTSITLAAERLDEVRDEIDDPLALRSLDILLREVTRFRRLFDDLLAISRVDSGRVRLSVAEQDLTALVDAVIADNQIHIDRLGADVRVHAPDEPVVAQMDTVRVERIVRNVLVNALEHAEGTPIDITVAGNEGAVAVRVRDHGVGMTPEVASKVFDRFYRAAPSRQRTLGGTGLGLSISAEDAVLHGGTLEVWGWPDEGASFLLTLPRHLGADGERGTLTGPRPLDVVPEDAPELAKAGFRAAGVVPAVKATYLPPAPASRRTTEPRTITPEEGDDAPAPPPGAVREAAEAERGRVTVRGPGFVSTAQTPEDVQSPGRRR
ncbi:histidine kinase [Actinomyces sp. oral taxon 414]|uniref:MtrAB system histidine kinase MtrB n=1 Tax=Actinomyces sp. oral taxon 414 TaxID=712122 RepID=UPI0006BD1CCB|nr:MtrAB system histidine kinase MtrB [Actinomyces sp. oral taxon 414]ALC99706.1 histidine kinase [Actinomyces sp. oral taxon 414]